MKYNDNDGEKMYGLNFFVKMVKEDFPLPRVALYFLNDLLNSNLLIYEEIFQSG